MYVGVGRVCIDSRARMETESEEVNQGRESKSAKKPEARECERKSAKFKAQKKSEKAPALKVPRGSTTEPA